MATLYLVCYPNLTLRTSSSRNSGKIYQDLKKKCRRTSIFLFTCFVSWSPYLVHDLTAMFYYLFSNMIPGTILRERRVVRYWHTWHMRTWKVFFYWLFFSSNVLSSPFFFSLPSLICIVVTQIRGHIAGSFPPLPATVRAVYFYRERISALSSLVDSRRIVLTHARRSQQLILVFIFANKFIISPRRDSNSRSNTSSIRGLPLDHRGDRSMYPHKYDIANNIGVFY